MKIVLQTINKERVVPIPIKQDTRKVKGCHVCSEPYANIALIARKKSGKTSAVNYMLKRFAGGDTIIYAFVSTLYKDANWKYIRQYFNKKGNEFNGYQSIMDDGENQLEGIVSELREKAKEEEEKENNDEEEEKPMTCFDLYQEALKLNGIEGDNPNEDDKPKKCKYLAPEYIFVFDDLSRQLKNPVVIELLKSNRHYRCKVILSTQYIHDIPPEGLKQIDFWLLFKGQPLKKLAKIYLDADISIPFESFVKIYRKATKHKFNFLYIDTRDDSFRRNFNERMHIKHDEITDIE